MYKRQVQLIEPPAAGIPAGVYVIAKANWFNRYRVGVDEDLLSVHKVLAPLVSPASKVGERSLVVFSVDSLSKLG